ncbi:DUF1648 domain-containing protein [Propionibacteriaceae bacterium G1746]
MSHDDVSDENLSAENLVDDMPSPWPWAVATAVVGLVGVWLLVREVYPAVPDPMPTHWNGQGVADEFAPRTPGRFIGVAALGPGLMLLTLALVEATLAVLRTTTTHDDAQERLRANIGAARKHLGWYLFAMSMAVMGLVAALYSGESSRWVLPVFLVAVLVLTVVLVVAMSADFRARLGPDQRARWWGPLYRDPDDPRVLVATGTNYTFNVAHQGGVIGAVVLLAMPLLVVAGVLVAVFAG